MYQEIDMVNAFLQCYRDDPAVLNIEYKYTVNQRGKTAIHFAIAQGNKDIPLKNYVKTILIIQ